MGQRASPPLLRLLGWAAVFVMAAAGAAMLVMWLW